MLASYLSLSHIDRSSKGRRKGFHASQLHPRLFSASQIGVTKEEEASMLASQLQGPD